jgi:hypothetical protein
VGHAPIASGSKKEKRVNWVYFSWQIWKERNSRVFQDDEHSANRVAMLIRDQVSTLAQARESSAFSADS